MATHVARMEPRRNPKYRSSKDQAAVRTSRAVALLSRHLAGCDLKKIGAAIHNGDASDLRTGYWTIRNAPLQHAWRHFPARINSAQRYRSQGFHSVPAATTNPDKTRHIDGGATHRLANVDRLRSTQVFLRTHHSPVRCARCITTATHAELHQPSAKLKSSGMSPSFPFEERIGSTSS